MNRRALLATSLAADTLLPVAASSRAARTLPLTNQQGVLAMAATPVPAPTAADARAIAKDAYIYGFPIVDNYRIMYSYFEDEGGPEYKAPWNTIFNNARVYTPQDTALQTPNSDTPYSYVGADLRTEPLVFTVPEVEEGRYFSLQFIDLYTFNFAYVGSRATGNGGGNYLLTGPVWSGETPEGIAEVIPCETELALVFYRTQLFNPDDVAQVKAIQAGYAVQPLSGFLGEPAPPVAPPIDFMTPISSEDERTSLAFFDELNFLLQFCPTHPSEVALMQRFAQLGIGAGLTVADTPELRQAMQEGMADAWQAYKDEDAKLASGELSSGDIFGTREYLHNNYLYRMVAAVDGIYGNSKEEAIYPSYIIDASGQLLDGSLAYTLHFSPDQLPPVNAFWSVTMYELPQRLLVDNPLNRYLINSAMLPDMARDADGGLTLYVQHDSPGAEQEANWLPAPSGPFSMVMRLYWPKAEALDGTWKQPLLKRVD